MGLSRPLFLLFHLFNTVLIQLMVNTICRWLDSNRGSLLQHLVTLDGQANKKSIVTIAQDISQWSVNLVLLIFASKTFFYSKAFFFAKVGPNSCHQTKTFLCQTFSKNCRYRDCWNETILPLNISSSMIFMIAKDFLSGQCNKLFLKIFRFPQN